MSLTKFYNEKTPFQVIKKRRPKSRKTDIFQKGLTHGFGPKMAIFPSFVFGNIAQENVPYDILERKNAFLGYKKKRFKQLKNCHFSKRVNPWFWKKMAIFPTYFFQAIQGSKMSFTIFQNEKTPFQAIEIRGSKSRKIDIFHGFGLKMAIYPNFFLGNIGRENVFYDILEQKTPFQTVKTRSLYSRKIDIFPWNCSKNGNFSHFFQAMWHRKMSFTIFQNEKTFFQAIKTGSSKTRKNVIFQTFLTSFFLSLERCFFVSKYRKRLILPKKKVGKMAIFGPKLCVNPSRKKVNFQTF